MKIPGAKRCRKWIARAPNPPDDRTHVYEFTTGLTDERQRPKTETARQLIAFGMEPAGLGAQSLSRNKMTHTAGYLSPNQTNAKTF